LKSSQNRYVSLGEEIEMLRNYMELQQIRFDEKFSYHIDIDNKLPVDNIMIPSLLLQPLVENAINHGLFHSLGAGELLLRFRQGKDNTEMVCEIEDNGIGREASMKINQESSTKESYGTKLTNKLLDIFKDYEHMDINLEYTDKPYPGTGTIVTLTLKNLKYVT
jgi:LytS/YehU family sensor histidine kinase